MPVPECKKGLPYKFNTYEEVLLASPVSLVCTCITYITWYTENLKKINHWLSQLVTTWNHNMLAYTNLSINCLLVCCCLSMPFKENMEEESVEDWGEIKLSDSTVQYKAFNMITSSCAGAWTSVWPSDPPCLGETRPCHSSSRLSVSTAVNFHSTRLP